MDMINVGVTVVLQFKLPAEMFWTGIGTYLMSYISLWYKIYILQFLISYFIHINIIYKLQDVLICFVTYIV